MQEKVAKERASFYLFLYLIFLSLLYFSFYFPAALLSQNHRIIKIEKDLQGHQVIAEMLCFPQGNKTNLHGITPYASFLLPCPRQNDLFHLLAGFANRIQHTLAILWLCC